MPRANGKRVDTGEKDSQGRPIYNWENGGDDSVVGSQQQREKIATEGYGDFNSSEDHDMSEDELAHEYSHAMNDAARDDIASDAAMRRARNRKRARKGKGSQGPGRADWASNKVMQSIFPFLN